MLYPAHQEAVIEGKAYRLLRANVSATLAEFKLSMPEWTVMGLLLDNGELRLADLAILLAVEAPLITGAIKLLSEKKFVFVKDHPQDSRAKLVELTALGERKLPLIDSLIHHNLEPLMKDVASQDISAYMRVLEKIIANGA